MKTWLVIASIVVVLLAAVTGVGFGMLNSTKAELAGVKMKLASIEAELIDTAGQLTDIQSKFPLRRFKDNLELEAWLNKQADTPESSDAILWLRHAHDLQKAAANDGYIISADYWTDDATTYQVWCSAVLQDDSYYWWDPETDDIYYAFNINDF